MAGRKKVEAAGGPKKRIKWKKDNVPKEHLTYEEVKSGDAQTEKQVQKDGRDEEEQEDAIQIAFHKVPTEIWLMIFEYTSKPEEFLKVLNTCGKWFRILEPERNFVLFPLVIQHLVKYLPPSDFIKLRQTCKSWKRLIDTHLQNYGTTTSKFECHWWHKHTPFSRALTHLEKNYTIASPANVTPFLETMSSHQSPDNPFISQSLSISFERSPNFQTSHDQAMTLLQKYGSHILDFTHTVPDMLGQEGAAVILLPALLGQLPKIHSLKIDWFSEGGAHIPPEAAELLRGQPGQQFPALRHLTSLNFDFRGAWHLEAELGIALLQCYGPQLETLICRGEFLECGTITPDFVKTFLPNLKNLRIFCVTTGCLQKLSQFEDLPLRRLQLWYSFQNLQLKTVLDAINPFASTLTLLHLDVKLYYPLEIRQGPAERQTPHVSKVITRNSEELNVPFPNLTKFCAPVSSVNFQLFWDLVTKKFPGLELLELQTPMEIMFAPYEKKYLKKEIHRSKGFFKELPNLDKIQFWFHNQGGLIVRRGDSKLKRTY